MDVARWRPSGGEWARTLSLVQERERERIRRFVFKRDAKASLVGQLMLRKVIREALQLPNELVQLERSDRGKPYYPAPLPFRFNVSHQGSYTVLAASSAQLVGVDLMRVDKERFLDRPGTKLADFFHTMRRQFTPREWGNIRLGTEEDQLANFYRHWCLKESYVKAVGVGITMDLLSLDFEVSEPLKPPGGIVVTSTGLSVSGQPPETTWRFEEQLLDESHCVCVALSPPVPIESKAFELLSVEDLTLPVCPAPEHDEWAREFESKEEEPVFV